MVTLREWRTAGIIQSVRVGAVLQEQWLKDGNSVAYASEAPWLCQDGCGWQDVKDIYSQLSPESWSAIPLNHFLFPPYPPSHAFSCSACGGWHRQKSQHTRGKVTAKLGPEYESFIRSLGKQLRAWYCLHRITQWFPHFTKPSDAQFLTWDSWDKVLERWILHCWSIFSGSFW